MPLTDKNIKYYNKKQELKPYVHNTPTSMRVLVQIR